MNDIAMSGYVDYLEQLSLEALRDEARTIDHDCEYPLDICRFCAEIQSASKDVLIQIILENK